jgi:hypothetical protein
MVDRYTKTVLTVIAAALVVIAAQHAVDRSQAATDIQKVQICDDQGRCASMTSHVKFSPGPLGGVVQSWAVPVAVEEIPNK